MRKFGKEKVNIESTFKATKIEYGPNNEDIDELEEKFTRNLKKGTEKYKGMLPLKCFSCGNIGHYASRSPNRSMHKKRDTKERKVKRMYYVKEDARFFYHESDYEDDKDECMFLPLESKTISIIHGECAK